MKDPLGWVMAAAPVCFCHTTDDSWGYCLRLFGAVSLDSDRDLRAETSLIYPSWFDPRSPVSGAGQAPGGP